MIIGNVFFILGSELHTLTKNQSPITLHYRLRDLQTSYYSELFKFAAIFKSLETSEGKLEKFSDFQ